MVELADALLSADRSAEAAKWLAKAHALSAADQRDGLWKRWMGALLGADDPACLTHMAEQKDDELFAAATALLTNRLRELQSAGAYQTVILLADQAAAKLVSRLTEGQLETIKATASM